MNTDAENFAAMAAVAVIAFFLPVIIPLVAITLFYDRFLVRRH